MKIRTITINSNEIKEKIFSLFNNKVFHVTNEDGYNGIVSSGFIKTNKDGINKSFLG